ncbi:MAG: S-layer protein [Paenibacillus sp.]|jgi:alpha-tubulin suppressor-like RCC1 family protein|nr:S-layer protein [Paenibacillus sp.]
MVENVYSFGSGANGRLGHGDEIEKLSPAAIEGLTGMEIKAVSAGYSHTLVLTVTGDVYSFGSGANGRLGHGDLNDRNSPTKITGLAGKTVTSIAAGKEHSLVLTDTGEIFSFGNGILGQLGHGDTAQQNVPEQIIGIPPIQAISAGGFHSLALTEAGEVYSFGHGGFGRTGHDNTAHLYSPVKIATLSNIKAISAGETFSLALASTGDVYSFGFGAFGQLGHGDTNPKLRPTKIDALTGKTVKAVSTGFSHSLVLTDDGEVYSFGNGYAGLLGHGDDHTQLTPKKIESFSNVAVRAISAGGSHSTIVTSAGEAYTFGEGFNGALGLGDRHNVFTPTQIDGLLDVQFVSAGFMHTMAIASEDDGLTYSVGVSATEPVVFYSKLVGYTQRLAESITLTKTGTGNISGLTAALSGVNANAFEFVNSPAPVLNANSPSTTISIRPKLGLAAGVYTAAVNIAADKGVNESFDVSFTVTASPTYSVDISHQGTVTFAEQTEGYSLAEAEAESVIVARTGTGDIENLSIRLDGGDNSAFLLGTSVTHLLNDTVLSISFLVRPKQGLTVGTYTDTVRITANNGISESFNVRFTVNAAPKITNQPSGITADEGSLATFAVAATGTDLTYQWQLNTGIGFANLIGETGPTITIANIAPGMSGNMYRVVISGRIAPPAISESAALIVNPIPDKPTIVGAVAGNAQVRLHWDPVNHATGYAIYSRMGSNHFGSAIATVSESVYSFDVSGLVNGTSYAFVVKALNGALESPPSNEVHATPQVPAPGAPVLQSATAGNGQVQLIWNPAAGSTGYMVFRSETSGAYATELITVAHSVYTYTVTGLSNGMTYYFVVRAANPGGESANSNEASATPMTVPAAPTNVTAVAGNGQATVTFAAPTENGGSAITAYEVTASPGNVTMTGAASPITVTGLTNGTTYTFTVKAMNGAGSSEASAASNAVLPTAPLTPELPKPPVLQSATAGNGQVQLIWNPAAGSTGYKVLQSETSGTYATEITTVANSVFTYTVTGLSNGTTYYFVVRAANSGGDSANSNEASATPMTVPAAPTNVTAVAGNGQATVAFAAPTDNGGSAITAYEVTASPGNVTMTGAASPITVTGLTNGTTYTFTVKAMNGAGSSEASAASNAVGPTAPSTGGDVGEDSSSDSQPITPESPTPTNSGVDVLVNGNIENMGTATTEEVNGQQVTIVAVDEEKLQKRLESESEGAIITIATSGDVVVGELNGRMVKSMEVKQAVLEIRTEHATYTLPAQQIDIDAVSKRLGTRLALQDIKVRIEIATPSDETIRVVEDAAASGGFTLVVPPLNFNVIAIYGDRTEEVMKFNAYVERSVAIPKGIDPSRITTGVVVEPDGTFRHVPTKIVNIDGIYYAQINSLTNSTYSVAWHPMEFRDAAMHWAKHAINDMGSRMVIEGTEKGIFSPDRNITRAEFAAIIVRGLGLRVENGVSVFKDVKTEEWYGKIINTAYSYSLIDGFEDGTFRPNETITREQAMVVIAKAMAVTGLKAKLAAKATEETLRVFADAASVSKWATSGIADSVQAGIIFGRNGSELSPNQFITRAEVATMIERLLQRSELI